ncbi:MAG: HisA/HisF-related TIM barrel protein [Candidatus Bathyarchaeota archaeon]|nr:HisA/HisF-related TIM barrel protein [Candidatus Bathyarchaeota archaeon]
MLVKWANQQLQRLHTPSALEADFLNLKSFALKTKSAKLYGKLFTYSSLPLSEAKRMRIIPVIDIKNGVVVHAVKGNRSQYLPLQSPLCSSADPIDVALAFRACGFSELYVADLDAITGTSCTLSAVRGVAAKTGLKLMVDAGVSDMNRAEQLLRCGVAKVVIGTETLSSLAFIEQAVRQLGSERVVVSLDLKAGTVLSQSASLQEMSALELTRKLESVGVTEIIVLDLDRVGSSFGVNLHFLKDLLTSSNVAVLVGGGVRGIDDLAALRNLGVQGVLVATALHTQKISLDELQRAGLLDT